MMNKLVLDLYRRAHVPSTAIDPSNNMPYETTQFSADRFAELIVEECAAVADKGYASDNFGNGITGTQLLKLFGLEK